MERARLWLCGGEELVGGRLPLGRCSVPGRRPGGSVSGGLLGAAASMSMCGKAGTDGRLCSCSCRAVAGDRRDASLVVRIYLSLVVKLVGYCYTS